MTEHRVLNGRYRIETLIGRGGMADVYRGHDLSLERPVAVKMLRPDLARDPQFQTRFRREAQSSASLNHPNIVGVYDTGATAVDGNGGVKTPFIVMEYVDGVTLRHILHGTPNATGDATLPPPPPGEEDGTEDNVLGVSEHEDEATQPISPPLQEKITQALGRPLQEREAAEYMDGVLAALGYSHDRGIVHRDIKPSNVMVCSNGDVKVMDFGIARAVADSAQTMTQTSSVVGTAQYLSPEQARGEVVDHRSDLYSAGCVLFELLTNRPPFVGESPVSVAYQHVREEPPAVSDFNNRISPAMESVVAKALAKNPADRFQTAEEFRAAIEDALRGISVDEDATTVVPAVAGAAAGGRSGFDDVVGMPLSARTPEDPDVEDYYTDYREQPPERRRRSVLWPIFWVLVVLGLIVGAVFVFAQLTDTTEVEVPDVEGLSRSEAIAELNEHNLTAVPETEPHEEVEEDHVIRSDPEPGTSLEPNSEVIIYISEGPGSVTVPDGLIGQDIDAVTATLEDVGLEVGEVTEEDHAEHPEGAVVATDPESGTSVEPGDSINLVVSTGLVQLPGGLLGDWRANVEETLSAAGFDHDLRWEVVDPDEEDVSFAGEVFRLEINGEEVDEGELVPNNATVVIYAVDEASFDDEEEDEDDEDDDEDNGNEDEDDDADDENNDEDNGNDDEDTEDE
ncbi:protein kinase domain-containing protein [Nesterenkonia alba]|uniref:protein kinase domain-containing protein n=1 Tax=Nesterenkonia alba TaxID=515814 RepID=UPI0003B34F84|nr:protein kinase [Nesterenkonia alba]